jgi:transposase
MGPADSYAESEKPSERKTTVPHTLSVRQNAHFRKRVVTDALKRKNVSETARIHRVPRQTVYRWLKRYDGTVESLMDKKRTPKSHPRAHTEKEINLVKRCFAKNRRFGLVCFYIHLKQNKGYTRSLSALYRLLRREGLLPPPTKRKRHKSKLYEPILVPGERVQVDVKHVPKECLVGQVAGKKFYQYTAIDECTRWRFLRVYPAQTTYYSKEFAKELQRAFPFEIQCIQTDNGSEFTSILQGSDHPSAFEAYLEEEGIRHNRIAVATPRH